MLFTQVTGLGLLCVGPPQLDGLVVLQTGGGDDVLRGVTGGAQHHVRVARQLLNDLLRLQVPDVHLGGAGDGMYMRSRQKISGKIT